MPRNVKRIKQHDIGVDDRFSSPILQKLINVVMNGGKKSIARKIVYDAMDMIVATVGGDDQKGLDVFEKALAKIIPHVEVRSRRVGGGVYQVPVQVNDNRKQSLAFRWLLKAAKSRGDKTMGNRLGRELLDAFEGRGGAVKKRGEVQKMAEANRAFSHYAW